MDTYTGHYWTSSSRYNTHLRFDEVQQNVEMFERATSPISAWLYNEFLGQFEQRHIERAAMLAAGVEVPASAWLGPMPRILQEHFHVNVVPDFMETRTMDVDILNFRTSSVFQTGIVQDVFSQNPNISFLIEPSGRIVTQNRMPRNAVYTVTYGELIDFSEFYNEFGVHVPFAYTLQHHRDMLQNPQPDILSFISRMLESYWRENGRSFNEGITISHNGIELCYEILLNYYLIPQAEWVVWHYTRLPEEFPERIRDLAFSVTDGAANNYERARMLERYLSLNYAYTLQPGPAPSDVDFVYHFLFDVQAGYCTYFATAFVTMARSIGLPARYVEGFMVVGRPDAHGFYNVLNSMAHAWAEVHFEGHGWVRFEPTPAVGLPTYYVPVVSGIDLFDFDEFFDLFPAHFADDFYGIGSLAIDRDGVNNSQQGAAVDFAINPVVYAVIAIGLILIIILSRAVWIYIKALRVRQKENGEAVVNYFEILLKYMKFFNFGIDENETVSQFASRVDKCFDNRAFSLKDIAEIFSKARYSKHTVSFEEREVMESAVKSLDAKMQSSVCKGKYFVYKYVLAVV